MQLYQTFRVLLLASPLFLASAAFGAGIDVDKDRTTGTQTSPSKVGAGECPSEGSAAAELDANNVRAALYNNGNLFFAATDLYEVPKGSGLRSVFASGIWIGGFAGTELRMAAATYSNFEFRPGPLFEDGTAPTNCEQYDHLWKVTNSDVDIYRATGIASGDLSSWPTGLGAPTLDAEGNLIEFDPSDRERVINLAAGEVPQILGDQTIWWVMNDVAAVHNTTNTPPIGLEAQVTAFAFNQAGALGNTTFYKYRLTYKGSVPLTDTWIGLWSDPDLGGAGDDYVGSDPGLGMGYVYNASPTDGDYGDRPPALGYDFFQGPLVPAPGETWTDPDGTVHEDATRLGMEKFVYYSNINDHPQGNPVGAQQYYGYLTGFWPDGEAITFGGTGRGFSTTPYDYMYDGEPPGFWSEFNIDNAGTAVTPGDRRFLQSTGPFTMNPGDVQEVVFAIMWSQETGPAANPHLASLQKLKRENALVQSLFDINFALPAPPDAPRVNVTELDQSVVLTWDYPPSSNNYLGSYRSINPLISDVPDSTFDFEGFIVYQYDSASDQQGQVIAVYDIVNGITRILEDTPEGLVNLDVEGTDSGLQWSIRFDQLNNYTDYHFGVQAYAYNEFSSPRTYKSFIQRVRATPARVGPRAGGTLLDLDAIGAAPDTIIVDQVGQGVVSARVLDPNLVTGATYRVEFYDAEAGGEVFTVYDVINVTSGQTVFSGSSYLERSCVRTGTFELDNCAGPPQTEDVFAAEGLSFSIQGPPAEFQSVDVVDESGNTLGNVSPNFALNPAATRPPNWFLTALGSGDPDARMGNIDWQGAIAARTPVDIEIRFVENPEEEGQLVFSYFWNGADPDSALMVGWTEGVDGMYDPMEEGGSLTDDIGTITEVQHQTTNRRMPFTVWEISPDGTERQVMAAVTDDDEDLYWDINMAQSYKDAAFHIAPGGYERVYASSATYDEAAILADPFEAYEGPVGGFWGNDTFRTIGRLIFVPYSGFATIPSPGTRLRLRTTKPNLPGDVFTFSTEEFAPQRGVTEVAELSLDDIGIVPNPYKGASAYEVSPIQDEVRITNLPQQATIRIFTLSGTLIRTLQKSSPDTFTRWDLQTENGLPIASGMYLIHVETDLGDRVIKFGVVKKRVQLNEL